MSKKLCLFGLVFLPVFALCAECVKCEKNRRYHAEHPEENWEFYDDYLEHKKKMGEKVTEIEYDVSENDNPSPHDR